jgi:putative DNA primase/helicase
MRWAQLSAKLATESAGILQWMVKGCLAWQRHGLAPPTIVTAATAAYLETQDAMAAWIDECCVVEPRHWESSANLFSSWSAWATKSGEFVGSLKRFVERLENRPGMEPKRPQNVRGFLGLRLRNIDYDAYQ